MRLLPWLSRLLEGLPPTPAFFELTPAPKAFSSAGMVAARKAIMLYVQPQDYYKRWATDGRGYNVNETQRDRS